MAKCRYCKSGHYLAHVLCSKCGKPTLACTICDREKICDECYNTPCKSCNGAKQKWNDITKYYEDCDVCNGSGIA